MNPKALLSTVIVSLTAFSSSNAANLLVNGGFESSLTGWTTDNGVPSIKSVGTYNIEAFDDFYFSAGTSSNTQISQIIDLSAFATDIDSGNGRAYIGGALGSWNNQDIISYTLSFRDELGGEIGTSLSLSALDNPLLKSGIEGLTAAGNQELSSSVIVPVGTRSYSVVLSSPTKVGGDNDGYADNLVADFTVVPEPSAVALLGLGGVALLFRRNRR